MIPADELRAARARVRELEAQVAGADPHHGPSAGLIAELRAARQLVEELETAAAGAGGDRSRT